VSLESRNHYLPKAGFLSRLMLFSAPVALACALVQGAWPGKPAEASGDNTTALNCAMDEEAAWAEDQADDGFFDTSWLPSRGDFAMIDSGPPAETMWNPLAKTWLTSEQLALLGTAYAIGYQDGGKEQARLVQAVLLEETIAGQLGRLGDLSAPMGKRSYGVMQVKVAAARDVLRHRPRLGSFISDEQLITRLITDDEFNIRVASAYLKHLRRLTGDDHEALVAYNVGMNGARRVSNVSDFKYVQGVERYLSEVVQRYNTKFSDGDDVRVARM
jgi:hypothetical protein